jgi:hypothetical protein
MQQKPALVNAISWMTLASGIVNVFWSIIALSHPIGLICAPISILPLILGVCEIIYAAKLFSNTPQPIKPSTNLAIFEIAAVLYGNVFAMVVGILSLVFYNDQIVKDYFAHLNGTAPVAPALTVPPSPAAPLTESTVPEPEPPENPDIPNPS